MIPDDKDSEGLDMAKNSGNKRAPRIEVHQELQQLLSRVRQKEQNGETRSATLQGPSAGGSPTFQRDSEERLERDVTQLSLNAIAKLADLSQNTSLWLERLDEIRASAGEQSRELDRLSAEARAVQTAHELKLKDFQQQRQKLEAEIKSMRETLQLDKIRREREERDHRERLKKQREENEQLMAQDQQMARQKFIAEMNACERENREKLVAFKEELNKREAALKKQEEEWIQTIHEFEKLSLRISRRAAAGIEAQAPPQDAEARNQLPAATGASITFSTHPRPRSEADVNSSRQTVSGHQSSRLPEAENRAISALAEEIVVHPIPEKPPAAHSDAPPIPASKQQTKWDLADALAPKSPIAASEAVLDTIVDLLSRDKEASRAAGLDPAAPAKKESSAPSYSAIIDTIFKEDSTRQEVDHAGAGREGVGPSAGGEAMASLNLDLPYGRKDSVAGREEFMGAANGSLSPSLTLDLAGDENPETYEAEESSGSFLGKFRRKVKTLKTGHTR